MGLMPSNKQDVLAGSGDLTFSQGGKETESYHQVQLCQTCHFSELPKSLITLGPGFPHFALRKNRGVEGGEKEAQNESQESNQNYTRPGCPGCPGADLSEPSSAPPGSSPW